MKKVVFLLGTMSRFAPRGDALSSSDLRILEEVADAAGVEADVVFATQTILCAKNPARASMKLLREERDRVIEEIKGYDPDVVIVFGPIALKSITDKGNIPLNESMRQQFTSEELDMPFVVTYSMDMVNAKPGVKKWLILDTLAAVNGQTVTEWGDYVVLDPSDDNWNQCPSDYCELSPGEVIGFDLETFPAFDPWHPDARIRMAIISREAHKSHIIQLGPDSQLPAWLRRMAETPLLIKAGSNIKFDYKWLRRFGCEMQCMQDTSVSEHIIDETNPYKGLKHLTFIYAPWLGDYSKEHRVLVAERGGWEFVEDNEQYQYAGGDGEASYCTAVKQRELIKADGLQRPFILSHDLYVVLCEMEHNGCMVDMDVNADLDVKFQQAMSVLRSEITDTLGPINPGSPKVLADALKDKIPGLDLTKTKIFRYFKRGQAMRMRRRYPLTVLPSNVRPTSILLLKPYYDGGDFLNCTRRMWLVSVTSTGSIGPTARISVRRFEETWWKRTASRRRARTSRTSLANRTRMTRTRSLLNSIPSFSSSVASITACSWRLMRRRSRYGWQQCCPTIRR